MSISELKDHLEMILFIIQISCVLSFTDITGCDCPVQCRYGKGEAVVWGVRQAGKHHIQTKQPEACLEGRKGRRGKVFRKVGNFQTPHTLPSTIGKGPQDFMIPKI